MCTFGNEVRFSLWEESYTYINTLIKDVSENVAEFLTATFVFYSQVSLRGILYETASMQDFVIFFLSYSIIINNGIA